MYRYVRECVNVVNVRTGLYILSYTISNIGIKGIGINAPLLELSGTWTLSFMHPTLMSGGGGGANAAAAALMRLASAVCPATSGAHAHAHAQDLCLGPTLPPSAAIGAAASFGDLDDLLRRFESHRVDRRTSMHSASGPLRFRTKPGPLGVVESVESEKDKENEKARHPDGLSFAHCMLQVADPSVPLLSAADCSRCVLAFVERAAARLTREAQQVAAEYRAALGTRAPSTAEVRESLRDAVAALQDRTLHDAAVLMLSKTLRVTVAVLRDTPSDDAAACALFPPSASEPDRPAVLVVQRGDVFGLVPDVSRLEDVQRHVAYQIRPAVGEALAKFSLRGAKGVTLSALVALASRAAVATVDGRGVAVSKATLVERLLRRAQGSVRTLDC